MNRRQAIAVLFGVSAASTVSVSGDRHWKAPKVVPAFVIEREGTKSLELIIEDDVRYQYERIVIPVDTTDASSRYYDVVRLQRRG
jgi:hypothetical protein